MSDAVSIAAAPRPVARSVAVSASAQLVARGFDMVVNVAVSLAIVRHLGPQRYGDFVLVVTVIGLAGLLSEFGLPKLAVREVSREGGTQDEVVGTVIVLRLGLCVLSALVAQLALLALHADAAIRVAALVACSQFVGEALLTVVVVFHVALKQQYEAVVRLLANVVKLFVVAVLLAVNAGLVALVAATTGNVLVAALLGWLIARRRFGLRPSWDGARAMPLVRASLPIGPAMLIGVLYLKLDALMVALLATRADVGIYGAAYQPIEYLFLASAIVVQVTFPLLARAHGRDRAAFDRVYQRGTELVLATVTPVAILLSISARPLVHVAYRDSYRAAALPMALLAVSLVLMTANVWQGLVLLAANRQAANLAYLGAAVTLNVVLDVFLVPALGPAGAAWGTLSSAAFLVGCSTFAVAKLAGAALAVVGVARVLLANGLLLAILGGLRAVGVHWVVAALVGACSYVPLLAMWRVFGAADLRAVLGRGATRQLSGGGVR